MFRKLFVAMAAVLAIFALSSLSVAASADNLVLTLKDGSVTIRLRPDLAPKHVAQIEKLVKDGAYDNVVFHRVIPGFMAQTGDVKFGKKGGAEFNISRAGMGGSSYPDLPAEFSKEPFKRGTVGMARSQNPNSANSQFFICFDNASFLNGQYTVVGEVVKGMNVVDKIKKGRTDNNGSVADPDVIVKARIETAK